MLSPCEPPAVAAAEAAEPSEDSLWDEDWVLAGVTGAVVNFAPVVSFE